MPNLIENLLDRLTPQPHHLSPDSPEAAVISNGEAEESHERVDIAGIATINSATATDVDHEMDTNGVNSIDETALADGSEEMAQVDETQADQLSSEVAATFAAFVSTDNADADLNDTNHAATVAPEPTSHPTSGAAASSSPTSANIKTGGSPRKRKANPKEKQSNDNASPTMTGMTEWKGEIGPDNAIRVDDESGEREWEISKICSIEEDDDGSKTIIVRWKGWKGFWPEEYEAIKTQVPDLVEKFEKGLKAEEKGKKTQNKRGPKPKGLKPKAGKAEKAKKRTAIAAKQAKKAVNPLEEKFQPKFMFHHQNTL
ncbi:hypothetical protein DV737_g2567, partial [Chaetothyriales sp. CBS 132003]